MQHQQKQSTGAIAPRSLGPTMQVSAIGMGCWAIGGPMHTAEGSPIGWGDVDDAESIRAIHRAIERGITLFDTADVYGSGHSECILGQAIADRRDRVVIASKFGFTFDAERQIKTGRETGVAYMRQALTASLQRLGCDRIDCYQLHLGRCSPEENARLRDALEEEVQLGRIASYGISSDEITSARVFAEGTSCVAVQMAFNLFQGRRDTLEFCAEKQLAALCRSPLGMGILTGKFSNTSRLPENDVRHGWRFDQGWEGRQITLLDRLRDLLTCEGHSLAQGALAWLLTRAPHCIPIPGCRTVKQVDENAGVLDRGLLSDKTMASIAAILSDEDLQA